MLPNHTNASKGLGKYSQPMPLSHFTFIESLFRGKVVQQRTNSQFFNFVKNNKVLLRAPCIVIMCACLELGQPCASCQHNKTRDWAELELTLQIMFLNMTMTTTIMRVDVTIFASLGARHHDKLAYVFTHRDIILYYFPKMLRTG